ncbi:MAG: hypothetical protein HRT80_02615 [Henriciella sp.]|nr:hypothetical protein [Henriciella sp.]
MARLVTIWIVKRDEFQAVPKDWRLEETLQAAAQELGVKLELSYTIQEKLISADALPDAISVIASTTSFESIPLRSFRRLEIPKLVVSVSSQVTSELSSFGENTFLYPISASDEFEHPLRDRQFVSAFQFLSLFTDLLSMERASESMSDARQTSAIEQEDEVSRRSAGVESVSSADYPDVGQDSPRDSAIATIRDEGTVIVELKEVRRRLLNTRVLSAEVLRSGSEQINTFVHEYLNQSGRNSLPEGFEILSEISKSFGDISSILTRQNEKIEELEKEIERLGGQVQQLNEMMQKSLSEPLNSAEAKDRRDLIREGFYTNLGGIGSSTLVFSLGAVAAWVFGETSNVLQFQQSLTMIKTFFKP